MRLNVCVGILNDVYRCVHSRSFWYKITTKKKKQPSKFLAPFFLSTAVSIYLANLRIKFMDSRGVICCARNDALLYTLFLSLIRMLIVCVETIYTLAKNLFVHTCAGQKCFSLSLSFCTKKYEIFDIFINLILVFLFIPLLWL